MNNKLLIALVIILLIGVIESKNKKKAQKVDFDRRPSYVPKELWCNACQAIIRESIKRLKHLTSEVDVAETLSEICRPQNFAVYEYPPPDMAKGCDAFVAGWDEEIEKALISRTGNNKIENEFCYEKTKACEGVDFGKVPKNDNFVNINGKKVPMGADGSVKVDEL